MVHALLGNEAMLAMNYARKLQSMKLFVNYLFDDRSEQYLFVYELEQSNRHEASVLTCLCSQQAPANQTPPIPFPDQL